MTHDIEHALELPANPDAVLAALTTPEGIQGWWAKDADVGDGVGARHTLRFDKEGRTVTMVFEVEEARDGVVRWRCVENDNPVWVGTTLEWRTEGEHLRFAHCGFAEGSSPPYTMTVQGWQHFVASLQSYLRTGAGQPW